MPYQSIYAGKSTATVPNSNKANPFADDFKPGQYAAKNQPKSNASVQPKQPKQVVVQPSQPKSLLSKVKGVAKTVGNSAIAGERTFATGIARDLPGGTNDLKAEEQASEQATKNIQTANKIAKANPTVAKKIIDANTNSADQAQKETTGIIKKMPSKTRIGIGAASTAADILTAGTLPAIKGASLTAKVARTGIQAGAFGTAGALNSAAAGGTKKQIAENFATGAVLPGALHVAGKVIAKGASKIDDLDAKSFAKGEARRQSTKDLITNTKTNSLLDNVRQPKSANLDTNTTVAVNSIMDKIHTPKSVLDKAQAESDATKAAQDATEKAAKETQKTVEQGKKIDNQIELINAKKADGKFTNVDKVKVAQLTKEKADLGAPSIKVFGKEIPMTEENGFKATPTKNGEVVYQKTAMRGNNNRGDRQAITHYYTSDGKNITQQQHDAMVGGDLPSVKTPDTTAIKSQKISNRKEAEYKPSKGEPVNVPYEQPEIKQPEIGRSKLARSTEQKAIDKKLTQGFEGKPEYAKVNVKNQATHALELLKTSPEQAERIALGKELPPGDLLPESVYVAVENAALKSGNVDLLRRLATESSLSSEATGMGQRIRMLGERDPDSAVTAMRKLAETRKAAAEKKLGKPIASAVKDETKQIKAATPKPTKETFNSFVESLKC